ncbi:putative NADPH:quinone reductase [Herbaspirillum frisingense GSF30]|uniref:NADPH:quinone reductase n=1 Tax=Herbaspirillum frisingense GSF30 TaxID=864073 RepID=A0AAI9N3H8_9BURK|nr:NADP-dependent oxidoreductase [Herbaspirillum frisingense]EOA04476.1 putative NADPH:quinone reductase [Herbaspirillum frisingense GSF30]
MNTIRSLQLMQYGGPDTVRIADLPAPVAGPAQVLVRVHAAGVNALDWKVREGYVKDAFPLPLPAVLGIELAGVVEQVGSDVSLFKVGDRVMGPLGGLGAYADLVAVDADKLAVLPEGLSMVQAAALPVAAVSAWQSLHLAGPLKAGQRILIHGAAGAVGGFAVQFAHQAGAHVSATALGSHADYVHGLGADHVIDYQTSQFEALVRDIDLVLDYVGGDTLARSWGVLAEDGVIVSTASPAILASTPAGRRGLWFMNQPDAVRLADIARQVAAGRLQSQVAAVVPFEDLPAAIERSRTLPQMGKTVVDFLR